MVWHHRTIGSTVASPNLDVVCNFHNSYLDQHNNPDNHFTKEKYAECILYYHAMCYVLFNSLWSVH